MLKDDFYSNISRDCVEKIVRSHATPAYLYFTSIIEEKIIALRNLLPPFFRINYALKANPHPEIVSFLAGHGIGADVASMGELHSALDCGIAPENIEFSGPGKTREELGRAIHNKIASINIESLSELHTVISLCTEMQGIANVGMRVNLGSQHAQSGLKMGGPTQFGIQIQDIDQFLYSIEENRRWLNFTGIHVHSGSQFTSAEAVCSNFKSILDLSLAVFKERKIPIKKINFGGGFGIVYFPHQHQVDHAKLRQELLALFDNDIYAGILKEARCIVEPGRFLVGECGLYATRVLYVKENYGRKYLVVDGGMHHNYMLAGGLGQVIRRNFELDAFTEKIFQLSPSIKYDIAGRLCTPQDILAVDFECPVTISEGDFVVFFNSGAYGCTASPVGFLSHARPQEIIINV
jgi:diaminopimelate decarboxylase